MGFTAWYVVIGAVLIFAVVTRPFAERFWLNTTMLYLGVGYALGPAGFSLITLDPVEGSWFLERMTEVVVVISLFSAGLKVSLPYRDPRWAIPLTLAFGSMAMTVALIAIVGVTLLEMPLGVAILLGAILAPTDPVLASDVQLMNHEDKDRIRLAITGEAGLNDGTAFPFVMLGLGLLGLHELGANGWRWLSIDLLWAIVGGVVIGTACGVLVARIIIHLRAQRKEAVGLDEFLALGLIALSYGLAVLAHSYGFLAVFAAGLALRRIERQFSSESAPPSVHAASAEAKEQQIATHPETAPAYMASAVLHFNEQAEHLGEFLIVLFVGAMLSSVKPEPFLLWFVPLLFFAIRPAAVITCMIGSRSSRSQRKLISWFGIRGIGSIYYLAYAIQHGLPFAIAEQLTAIVLITVAVSIIVHGLSVTPLMRIYERKQRRREATARAD